MAITELARDCLAFAGAVSEACSKTDGSNMAKELFIRSCHGIAFHTSNASYNKKGSALSEYELALTDLKEAEHWFYIISKAKSLCEADGNRLERKLASLKYRINKAFNEATEKGERKMKRFPPSKTVFSSARLKFRSPLMKDIDAYTELCSEIDGELSFEAKGEKNDIADLVKEYTVNSDFYIITRKNDDEMIGCMRLTPDGASGARYKLEFAFLPKFRACGYSYELINSAFEFITRKKNAVCLCAHIVPSFQFLEKTFRRCGFEKEGVLLSYGKNGSDVTVLSKKV